MTRGRAAEARDNGLKETHSGYDVHNAKVVGSTGVQETELTEGV